MNENEKENREISLEVHLPPRKRVSSDNAKDKSNKQQGTNQKKVEDKKKK